MTEAKKKPPLNSPTARMNRADETTRVATEITDAATEARENKTARLKAAREAAEEEGSHVSKPQKGRVR